MVTDVVPSPPQFLPSIFIAHRVQQSHCSSIFHRVLLTHALALSASQFVHKKKSPRIYTSMHSGGFEFTKLTYTRLEDNLIRHLDDRLTTFTIAAPATSTISATATITVVFTVPFISAVAATVSASVAVTVTVSVPFMPLFSYRWRYRSIYRFHYRRGYRSLNRTVVASVTDTVSVTLAVTFFVFLSSGGFGKIKLELATLSSIFIHVTSPASTTDAVSATVADTVLFTSTVPFSGTVTIYRCRYCYSYGNNYLVHFTVTGTVIVTVIVVVGSSHTAY